MSTIGGKEPDNGARGDEVLGSETPDPAFAALLDQIWSTDDTSTSPLSEEALRREAAVIASSQPQTGDLDALYVQQRVPQREPRPADESGGPTAYAFAAPVHLDNTPPAASKDSLGKSINAKAAAKDATTRKERNYVQNSGLPLSPAGMRAGDGSGKPKDDSTNVLIAAPAALADDYAAIAGGVSGAVQRTASAQSSDPTNGGLSSESPSPSSGQPRRRVIEVPFTEAGRPAADLTAEQPGSLEGIADSSGFQTSQDAAAAVVQPTLDGTPNASPPKRRSLKLESRIDIVLRDHTMQLTQGLAKDTLVAITSNNSRLRYDHIVFSDVAEPFEYFLQNPTRCGSFLDSTDHATNSQLEILAGKFNPSDPDFRRETPLYFITKITDLLRPGQGSERRARGLLSVYGNRMLSAYLRRDVGKILGDDWNGEDVRFRPIPNDRIEERKVGHFEMGDDETLKTKMETKYGHLIQDFRRKIFSLDLNAREARSEARELYDIYCSKINFAGESGDVVFNTLNIQRHWASMIYNRRMQLIKHPLKSSDTAPQAAAPSEEKTEDTGDSNEPTLRDFTVNPNRMKSAVMRAKEPSFLERMFGRAGYALDRAAVYVGLPAALFAGLYYGFIAAGGWNAPVVQSYFERRGHESAIAAARELPKLVIKDGVVYFNGKPWLRAEVLEDALRGSESNYAAERERRDTEFSDVMLAYANRQQENATTFARALSDFSAFLETAKTQLAEQKRKGNVDAAALEAKMTAFQQTIGELDGRFALHLKSEGHITEAEMDVYRLAVESARAEAKSLRSDHDPRLAGLESQLTTASDTLALACTELAELRAYCDSHAESHRTYEAGLATAAEQHAKDAASTVYEERKAQLIADLKTDLKKELTDQLTAMLRTAAEQSPSTPAPPVDMEEVEQIAALTAEVYVKTFVDTYEAKLEQRIDDKLLVHREFIDMAVGTSLDAVGQAVSVRAYLAGDEFKKVIAGAAESVFQSYEPRFKAEQAEVVRVLEENERVDQSLYKDLGSVLYDVRQSLRAAVKTHGLAIEEHDEAIKRIKSQLYADIKTADIYDPRLPYEPEIEAAIVKRVGLKTARSIVEFIPHLFNDPAKAQVFRSVLQHAYSLTRHRDMKDFDTRDFVDDKIDELRNHTSIYLDESEQRELDIAIIAVVRKNQLEYDVLHPQSGPPVLPK